MNERVKAARKEIIHKFCRTILWIDDEIHIEVVQSGPDSGVKTPKLFADKLSEFEQNGLLCHLKGFPQSVGKGDFYEDSADDVSRQCVKLARQSDVVIIDWMLGSVDSSEQAENIVKELLGKDKGFHFIVVLSKDAPSDTAYTALDPSFKAISDSGCLWKNDFGQFLLSLRKDEFASANLFDKICDAFADAYPDYLHLVAMEITGRIRDVVPQWFAAITSNADLGILVERGNTMTDDGQWRDDLQDCIASNLMDDLGTAVLSPEFASLSDDMLKPSNNPLVKFPERDGDLKNGLDSLKACVKDEKPVEFCVKNYKKLFPGRSDSEIKLLVEGIESFTEFCERRSCLPVGGAPTPGSVYVDLVEEAGDIAVCISGGCDCVRSQSLMFLVGKELTGKSEPWYAVMADKSYKGGKTILRFGGKAYVFCAQASSILWKSRTEVCAKKPVGTFRHDILNRLVSRFMYQIRRVAVNQPAISRNLRGEKGDEA